MKIALAGAGAFGEKHLDALKLIDGVEVISVVGRMIEPTPWRTRLAAWLRRIPAALARAGYWGGVTMWGAIKAVRRHP